MAVIHDAQGNGIGQENPLPSRLSEADVMVPVDIQGRYASTIQTHSAVLVPATTGTSDSAYIDCDGFDKLSYTMKNDASTNNAVTVIWSNDGVTQHYFENSPVDNNMYKGGVLDIRARYVKIRVSNTDAAPHTMNAWIYLKA